MKKEEKEIPNILYLYIHSKIFEKTKGQDYPTKEVISYLFEWHIPKQLRYLFLKECEKLGLVKLKKDIIEINKPIFKLEEANRYYEELGIWRE